MFSIQTKNQPHARPLIPQLFTALLFLALSFCSFAADIVLPTIDVSADQQRSQAWQSIGNVSRVTRQQIERSAAHHPAELLNALPGVWVSRGNGQEHLTAIRSPVLTGPGACGAFLMLENGIPIVRLGSVMSITCSNSITSRPLKLKSFADPQAPFMGVMPSMV